MIGTIKVKIYAIAATQIGGADIENESVTMTLICPNKVEIKLKLIHFELAVCCTN